jgi:hypothetical protein
VIGQPRRPADGAEEDRVESPQRREEIVRRHSSVTVVVRHAPVEALVLQAESAALLHGVEDGDGGLDHFGADTVARIERDAIRVHVYGTGTVPGSGPVKASLHP